MDMVLNCRSGVGMVEGSHTPMRLHYSAHDVGLRYHRLHRLMQVDLFVNYDCDLQAANLFERTLRGLARIVRGGESAPGMLHAMGPVVNVNAAARPKPHQLAADVALWVIRALDTWADPLKVSTPTI